MTGPPELDTNNVIYGNINSKCPILRILFPAFKHEQEYVTKDSLRDACLEGSLSHLPSWVRPQAWKVLLSYLPPEKELWLTTLTMRRNDYLQFLEDFTLKPDEVKDRVIVQIYLDLMRSTEKHPGFLLRQTESWSNYGLGNVEEHQRHSLLRRLEEINQRYRCATDRFTLYENKAVSPVSVTYRDYQWHSMLRILSVYAMLNPSIGYIQGMHEILLVLLRVFFAGRDHPAINIQPWESKVLGLGSTRDTEADAFWCFSLLMGMFREIFDFARQDTSSLHEMRQLIFLSNESRRVPDNGMVQALHQLSMLLQCKNYELWSFLEAHSLDPKLPYYSFRWMACLLAADLPANVVSELWDVLFSETGETSAQIPNAHIEMLVCMCCAMLLMVCDELYSLDSNISIQGERMVGTPANDVFHLGMRMLQSYSINTSRPIVSLALQMRQLRINEKMFNNSSTQPVLRVSSDMRPKLQDRLAATVQRGLNTPSRSVSWDVGNVPKTRPFIPSQMSEPQSLSRTETSITHSEDPTGSSNRHALLRRYTSAIQDSNAVASISKASTNLAAKALAWSTKSNESQKTPPRNITVQTQHLSFQDAPPELPIPSMVDSPTDRDSYCGSGAQDISLTSTLPLKSQTHTLLYTPPSADEDMSTSFSLPSLQAAALHKDTSILSLSPSNEKHDAKLLVRRDGGLVRSLPGSVHSRQTNSSSTRSKSSLHSDPQTVAAPRSGTKRRSKPLPKPSPTPVEMTSAMSEPTSPNALASGNLDMLLENMRTNEWIKDR